MVKPKKLKVKAFRLNPLTCLNERRISDFPLSISTDNVVSLKSGSLDNKSSYDSFIVFDKSSEEISFELPESQESSSTVRLSRFDLSTPSPLTSVIV